MKRTSKFFLPSVGNLVFLSVFITIVFSHNTHRLLGDTDTGIHIRAGEVILERLSLPEYDVFSLHDPPLHWTTHEWLSQVIAALIHRATGLTGIVIVFGFIIASTYWLLFRILCLNNRNIYVCTILVYLAIASSTLHWLARPHIFSLILTLVYLYVLDTYQYRNRNFLYLLPLIMLPWVNLHGGFVVGLILIGVYVGGNLVTILSATTNERTTIPGKAAALPVVLVACVLVCLVNPHGYHVLTFPMKIVSDRYLMDNVQEFQSPNFHGVMPFRYLFFLTIAIFAMSRSRANIIELMTVLLFTHMSLFSARYIPLFAIAVSPILARHAGFLLDSIDGKVASAFKRRAATMARVDASVNGWFWPIATFTVVLLAVVAGRIHFHFDEKANPVAATEFLKREKLPGNMFNNETFGDYLIYTTWPRYKVFADGRHDVYGPLMKEYAQVISLAPSWEKVLQKYKINWVFENAGAPLSVLLLERQDWRLIYADKVAHIYMKHTPENEAMIQRFPSVKPVPQNNGEVVSK